MAVEPLGEPIVIRFDGLDADHEEVELTSFATSLLGLSKIISASAHFAITEKVALRKDKRELRVVIRPPREGCFVVDAIVQFSHLHPTLTDYASGTLANLTSAVIGYMFARNAAKREEMKHLSSALEKAIQTLGSRDQPTIDRLLQTVDKMADAMAPAVKQAIEPVGVTARTLSVGVASAPQNNAVVDEPTKAAILSEASLRVDEEKTYEVLISELDMVSGACHVHIGGMPDDDRRPAKITDPVVTFPNNPYVTAMAAKERLAVRAKATLREGEIDRLYISNYADRPRGEPDFRLA